AESGQKLAAAAGRRRPEPLSSRPGTHPEEQQKMNFTEAVKACLNKYATFSGRAGKPEFWWFFLFQVLVLVVTGMVSDILNALAGLALILPGLAVGARR